MYFNPSMQNTDQGSYELPTHIYLQLFYHARSFFLPIFHRPVLFQRQSGEAAKFPGLTIPVSEPNQPASPSESPRYWPA